MANLVMGLASQTFARSMAEIRLSPCYHYQFSSINKAIDALFIESKGVKQGQAEAVADRLETEKKFIHQKGAFPQAFRGILVTEHGQ